MDECTYRMHNRKENMLKLFEIKTRPDRSPFWQLRWSRLLKLFHNLPLEATANPV